MSIKRLNLDSFGNKIRKIRILLDLNQQEMADKLGMAQKSVSRYEKNESEPTLIPLVNLSHKLSINLNWLAGIEKNMFIKGAKFDMFQAKKILENRIKFYKKEKFNDFQSQIIIIYRSILNAEINSREDIVTAIQNHDISSILSKFVELYSNFSLSPQKVKDECIEFIEELSDPEIDYIVAHKDDFIEMLAKDKDIFNRVFKKLFY